MMGYPASHPTKPKRRRVSAQPSLLARGAPDRLSAVMRDHNQLLKKIARKQKDLEDLRRRLHDTAAALAETQPLIIEAQQLDREIHALFDALLSRKRQPRGHRKLISAMYQMLQHAGVLSFRTPGVDPDDDPADPWQGGGDDPYGGHSSEGGAPPGDTAGPSAQRPGDAPQDQSLRGLFRRLATALHPDKVQEEGEKARRTELMKEISRAYEERDLARLLHLERAWMAGAGATTEPDGPEDETDRRCAHVERMNLALRVQLKSVFQELKDLRRSPAAEMMRHLRRSAGRGGPDPIAATIAAATSEIARARELRTLVTSFRDGRITLDELVRGPAWAREGQSPADDDADEDEIFEAAMDLLFDRRR